jgi:hypothetical protein
MLRVVAAVVFSTFALAQNAPDPEIVRAAKSPYDLARYINSHDEIDWEPLWRALGVDAQLGLPCSMDCAVELIMVENPEQVILIVDASLPYEVYLRFQKSEAGEWRVTGRYYANVWNGNPHRHEIVRAGSTQFLVVSTHRAHGSDVDEEREDWLDLSQTGFEPVFSHTVHGNERRRYGYERDITGSASANSAGIDLRIHYMLPGDGCILGDVSLEATYVRRTGPEFVIQSARLQFGASIPTEDFQDLAGISPSDESLIRYSLPQMMKIASGDNAKQKECVRDYLSHASETPEKKQLLDLLAKP